MTAVGNGSSTITATTAGVAGTVVVTVAQEVVTIALVPASVTLSIGQTRQLNATARDAGANAIAGAQFAWSSSSLTVATVNGSGLATAVGTGSATITATTGGVAGTAVVTVSQQQAASVQVSPGQATLTSVGQTVLLTSTVRDAGGNVMPGTPVTWSSGSTTVATVNAAGLVTAVANGTAIIGATASGVSGTATITVSVVGPVNDLKWERQLQPGVSFTGVWGSSSANVFAVGSTVGQDLGTIYRFDGTGCPL